MNQSNVIQMCPVCLKAKMDSKSKTHNIRIYHCKACGHCIAAHKPSYAAIDYHNQHPGDNFIEKLRVTRKRQALKILDQINALVPSVNRLLDFGCGRGWFLETAQHRGFQVFGADTSELSARMLRDIGIQCVLLSPEIGLDPATLPFKPQVMTLLDVAEHFPPDEVVDRLMEITSILAPELQLVAIKVPISNGLMYRAAEALNRIGKGEFLDRLYQVGTEPPHLSYFSIRSLRHTINKAGYRVVGIIKDCDFEPESLFTRAQTSIKMPTPISHFCGQVAVSFANWFNLQDSVVLFAKPPMVNT